MKRLRGLTVLGFRGQLTQGTIARFLAVDAVSRVLPVKCSFVLRRAVLKFWSARHKVMYSAEVLVAVLIHPMMRLRFDVGAADPEAAYS